MISSNIDFKYKVPSFDLLSDDSKLWIFQSTDKIPFDIVPQLNIEINNFISTWKSHGEKVDSDYSILFDHFILILADQSHTSVGGCSQDSMMRFIQGIQQEYKLSLLDRLNVAIIEKDEISIINKDDLVTKILDGTISSKNLMFDNTIQTKQELVNSWLKSIEESWLKRFY
jgi:hypothetical protein